MQEIKIAKLIKKIIFHTYPSSLHQCQFLDQQRLAPYEKVAHQRLPEHEGSHLRVRLVMEKVI